MKKLLALLVLLIIPLSALAGTTPPPGNKGDILNNNGNGQEGAYAIGNGLAVTTSGSEKFLNATVTGGGSTPAGIFPQLQYTTGAALAALSADTLASYAAHNTIENGLSYDPRDTTLGSNPAICAGYNIFVSDGHTTTYNYTIPFTGSSSTDNTNFMVFTEPSDGTGSATLLTTSQFSVSGVNTGSGTITLSSSVTLGNLIIVVHDDANGFINAATSSVASGGYVAVPDNCTIYGSQSNGTQLPEAAQLIGQSFTPDYGFQGQGTKPILRVIAPTGAAPAAGFNVSNRSQQFFEGFEITTNVPGYNQLGFLQVPVLIGTVGNSSAGGGQSPGIVAQYMTLNSGSVGFGAPIGGNSQYIFSVLRFNNFVANNAGVYGPLSDAVIVGNDFASNGAFSFYGAGGGLIIGPQQGAVGAAGASRIDSNRFEYNLEGVAIDSGALISFTDNQFDGNTACGLDLRTFWNQINITGGWFRGNANGGSGGTGTTTPGHDAHICFNSGSGSGGLHVSNVNFYTNYAEGATAPLGSANATTPPYVLDFDSAAANNPNIEFNGGDAQFVAGNNGASVTDFSIYRNGTPANLKLNLNGQAAQGNLANGQFPAQSRGLPSNSWNSYTVFGDPVAYGAYLTGYTPTPPSPFAYPVVIGNDMGVSAIYHVLNDFSHFQCDIIDQEIFPNYNPANQDNPLVTWLPSVTDPGFGAGFYQNHLTDTNACNMAALTWMTVPQQYKTYAQSAAVTTTGSWGNFSSYGGAIGLTSTTQNSALSFTITTEGPAYVAYELQATGTGSVGIPSGGVFTVSVDGTLAATVSSGGSGAWTYGCSGLCPGSEAPAAIRLPIQQTSSGNHVISTNVISSTTTANPVTILGVLTPPGKQYVGGNPTVFFGGQLPNSTWPTEAAAFNQAEMTLADRLFSDGLAVDFVNVNQYVNGYADMQASPNNAYPNQTGQQHIADAFAGLAQYAKQGTFANSVDPRNYGAHCDYVRLSGVTETQGSNIATSTVYTFSNADIGKILTVGGFTGNNCGQALDVGPTTTIIGVTTTGGAIMAANAQESTWASTSSCVPGATGLGLVAHDDTAAFEAAANVAASEGYSVVVPDNCVVRNMTIPSTPVNFQGAGIADGYGNNYDIKPVLHIAATGYNSDTTYGINLGAGDANSTSFRGFQISGIGAPYLQYWSDYGALSCLGTDSGTQPTGTALLLDHMTFAHCPVGAGLAFGRGYPITLTASTAGNQMTVTALSWTLPPLYPKGAMTGSLSAPFLSLGRPITGAGVPSNTIITALPATTTDGTGVYTLSTTSTVSSETMTATALGGHLFGQSQFSEYVNNGIGFSAVVSDWASLGDIFTSNYQINLDLEDFDNPNGYASVSSRFVDGRNEEFGGASLYCYGCININFVGNQWQYPIGGYSGLQNGVQLVNSSYLTFTGEWFQEATAPQVQLSASSHITFSNDTFYDNSAYAIGATLTGASASDYIAIQGGNLTGCCLIAPGIWTTASVPVHYIIDTSDEPYLRTGTSTFSMTSTGSMGLGTASPHTGVIFDALSNTGTSNSTLGLPNHTTANRPTTGVAGMFSLNTTTSTLEYYNQNQWNLLPYTTTVAAGANYVATSTTANGLGMQFVTANSLLAFPQLINGLSLSNDPGAATTSFDIYPGVAVSDDGSTIMVLSKELSKTTSSWTVGGGNGCLDNALAASTWEYIFLIQRTDTNVVDVACDTSLTTPTLNSAYTEKRLIGALETTTSSYIPKFVQYGTGANTVISYSTPLADVSTALADTASHLEGLTVPPGLNVKPYGNYSMSGSSAILWSSPEVFPGAPSATLPFSGVPGFSALEITSSGYVNSNLPYLVTNTSGQVALQATASTTTVAENTYGYEIDLTKQVPLAPSVYMNFLSGTMPAGASLTRSTTGWYFNSSGNLTAAGPNLPRFDYGYPGSSTLQGLLAEAASLNQLLWSRDWTQAAWVATNIVPALDQTGIDGVSNSASSLIASANGGSICQTYIGGGAGQNFPITVYAKRITGTGTVQLDSTPISLTSSWQRFSITAQNATNPQLCITLGTNGDEVAVDVGQMEGGDQFTSPIVTTTTTLTRGTETVTIIPTWYNTNGGAFVYQFIGVSSPTLFGSIYPQVMAFNGSNALKVSGTSGGKLLVASTTGGSINIGYGSPNYAGATYSSPGGVYGIATNNASFSSSAALPGTTTALTFTGGNQEVRSFEYWPYPLTTSQLLSVTP